MIAVAASAERTMFRKPAASRGPAARSPPEPAGRQVAYAQPSKPTVATVNVPAQSPIRSDPAHLAAKWTDSNQAAAARPGERKQATRRLSVVPFASIHPASQTPGMPASRRTQEAGSGLAININAF